MQAAGGGLSTSSKGTSQLGIDLALAGLSFQVLTICIFCGFFTDYMYRYFLLQQSKRRSIDMRMKVFFGFLGFAVVLITTRCVYRVAELHEGYSGGLIRDEGLFVGFEGV